MAILTIQYSSKTNQLIDKTLVIVIFLIFKIQIREITLKMKYRTISIAPYQHFIKPNLLKGTSPVETRKLQESQVGALQT